MDHDLFLPNQPAHIVQRAIVNKHTQPKGAHTSVDHIPGTLRSPRCAYSGRYPLDI